MDREEQPKPDKRGSWSSKLLKFIPRAAASAVSFQTRPFSPGRSSESNYNKKTLLRTSSSLEPNKNHLRAKSQVGKGFSGPLTVSIIPTEARRRPKDGEEFDFDTTTEPVSPKVSCIGQIEHRKKKGEPEDDRLRRKGPLPPKKQASAIRRIFGGRKERRAGEESTGRKADTASELAGLSEKAPPALGQIRRFASSRKVFAGFDWSEVQVAPVDSEHRNCHLDEEEEEEEEVMIPFSAPILVGGGGEVGGGGGVKLQQRKEINLWKRRTMAPPRPLRLHPLNGNS